MSEEHLVAAIHAYWAMRGWRVDVGVREVKEPGRGRERAVMLRYSAVRSDMVNALPRGYRGELARSLQHGP
jgi:hypothetical protein